ncbi:RNA polymerase sigma-54 factor [Lacihabitans sp. LS3-19]|uniref:RNA polymerase factor sigma-54 n=1 Tax=Lacihabitans sp. LS3-19 TaxID=2487335 RepID=UPI0020CDC8EA|nr:RNA polymerase factor sigma-54 [Lacihabitans sp. LS3-19]MCP9768936.1 RNA polymerase sigma-54 factor [Lacihabitans sp. LS3-19]
MVNNAQRLTLKQSQKVNTSQIQFLNLLYLNQQELEHHIEQELLENPFLETNAETNELDSEIDENIEDFSEELNLDQIYTRETLEDDEAFYKYNQESSNGDSEWQDYQLNSQTVDQSITEAILDQLKYSSLDTTQLEVAYFLVNSVNEKGFLDCPLSDIADQLGFATGKFFSELEVEEVKNVINSCEPLGFACYDLKDYFKYLISIDENLSEIEKINAIELLENNLEEIGNNDLEGILKEDNISNKDLSKILAHMATYSPYPTKGYFRGESETTEFIVPDYEIYLDNGKLKGDIISKKNYTFKVNTKYANQLKAESGNSAKGYINAKLGSAQWLMHALKQREETMENVIKALVYLQSEFLISGETSKLRPMILKDIANITGLTISTVSRVTSNKFAYTPIGVINLKSLFSEAILLDDGTTKSNKEIQEMVINILKNEDKINPYSDMDIQKELQKNGINLTRRTITKYRMSENIQSSKNRRTI